MREDPTTIVDLIKLSDKARRLGAKYGHKLMYMQFKQVPRNDVINFGDKRAAFSTQASLWLLQMRLIEQRPLLVQVDPYW